MTPLPPLPMSEPAIKALLAAVSSLGRAGVLSHTGHISASARAGSRMIIASKGLAHELDVDTFIEVALDRRANGPWVESVPLGSLHQAIYQDRPEVHAVLHTHSPFATAFALAQVRLPIRYEPLLRHGQTIAVPVVPWAPRGSSLLVDGVRDALRRYPETKAVLLANHGLLVVGPEAGQTAKLLIAIEEAAAAEIRASALGGATPMSAAEVP